MFVGKRLFKRDNDLQMLYAILEEGIPKPSERADNVPPAIDHIVMRALARSRDDRYQDAAELAADLKVVAQNNEWETEASTLSKFVRDTIPDELAAMMSTGHGSDPLTPRPERISRPVLPLPPPATDNMRVPTDIDDEEFAPRILIEESVAPEPTTTAETGSPQAPQARENNTLVWIVLAIVLASSLLFWIVVVPSM
jgi:hypothetical protein